jgi:hypothetical protein
MRLTIARRDSRSIGEDVRFSDAATPTHCGWFPLQKRKCPKGALTSRLSRQLCVPPPMMAYGWRYFSSYRLDKEILEDYLTKKFGDWNFYIQVS